MGAKKRELTAQQERLRQYKLEVTQHMLEAYGITWRDACGDDEPLETAIERGRPAIDFVLWWGEKYDLIPKSEWSWGLSS